MLAQFVAQVSQIASRGVPCGLVPLPRRFRLYFRPYGKAQSGPPSPPPPSPPSPPVRTTSPSDKGKSDAVFAPLRHCQNIMNTRNRRLYLPTPGAITHLSTWWERYTTSHLCAGESSSFGYWRWGSKGFQIFLSLFFHFFLFMFLCACAGSVSI